MKVYSSIAPPNYFFHKNPRDKKITLVHFCENIKKSDDCWSYDEYVIEVSTDSQMENYIQNHYVELQAEARGGPSAVQQLYANLDYISMMSGIEIPIEKGDLNG